MLVLVTNNNLVISFLIHYFSLCVFVFLVFSLVSIIVLLLRTQGQLKNLVTWEWILKPIFTLRSMSGQLMIVSPTIIDYHCYFREMFLLYFH